MRAGTLFDGHQPVDGPATVLIEDGRIVAVGANPPDGVEIADLGDDVTLLPGLVDPHQHLCFDAGDDVVNALQAASADELLDRARRAARTALAGGITTVRDLGDRDYVTLALRAELADDPTAGPELLVAGPPITTRGGHCWFLGGEVDDPSQLRAAVAKRAELGVDAIKVMATGGGLTPGSLPHVPQFDRDALITIVDEAHRHGLPVAAHAHAAQGIRDAVAAGVDSVEHCSFIGPEGINRDDDILRALIAAGTIASVTFGIPPNDLPPPPLIGPLIPQLAELARRMWDMGVPITIGSDAGISQLKPHDVLPYGATALTEVGATPVEALTAVTVTAARSCGLADRKGALRAGYDADVLAVRGDPTTDIDALLDVVAVYRAGVRVAGAYRREPFRSLS